MKQWIEKHPRIWFIVILVVFVIAAGAPRGYGG